MNKHDLNEYNKLILNYINHPKVQEMKKFIQHGATTTFEHCDKVARMSFLINKKLHLKADDSLLVPAALLHDFFLYDWHNNPNGKVKKLTEKHGFTHAKAAADNAKKYFDISDKMHSIIKSHMWPLNITHFPKCKEGIILCLADKFVAFRETIVGLN